MDLNLKPVSLFSKCSPNVFQRPPTPFNSTQHPGFFITNEVCFNLQTGQQNSPQLPQDEQNHCLSTELIPRKFIQNDKNKRLFPALKSSNNFATFDYDDNINNKIE